MKCEKMEIVVDQHTDVFEVEKYLLKHPGVKKVGIVTMDSVRITYDADVIAAKILIKAIGRCSSNKNSRNRSNNVISIRKKDAETAI